MNYGELVTAVKNYLEVDETTFNANIANFVQLCESDIYRQVQMMFATDTVNAVGAIVAGQKFYTLPNDFLSAYHFAIVNADGSYSFLLPKDHSLVNEITTSANAFPRYYAMYDDTTLIFGPKANATYDIELSYYRMPTTLVGADANTNWLSEFGEHALLFGTILQGYIFLKGDQDVIARYTDQYQSALASLKVITEGRQLKDSNRNPPRRLPS